MAKNLDAELAEAAGLDENGGGGEKTDTSMAVYRPPEGKDAAQPLKSRKNLGLLAVLLTMVTGIVCLFLFGFKEAAVYSMPVADLLDKGSDLVGRNVRIEGELVPGTLEKRDKPCEYRFRVRADAKSDKSLEVRYAQCIVPDSFRDVPEGGVMVTAEGALQQDGHFASTFLMAKCSSRYDATTHKMGDGLASEKPAN
jgi:cytochrome c-type biogenesis protein CcmE